MTIETYRKLPRAYDLEKIGYWLRVLHIAATPLLAITSRNLRRAYSEGKLSEDNLLRINQWKAEKEISLADDAEYRYLLRDLGMISSRPADPEVDPFVPLGGDGPPMSIVLDFSPRTSVDFLTEFGESLFSLLNHRAKYEATLFWAILRNQRYLPLIQDIMTRPESYKGASVEELLITHDSVSKNCAISWGRWFGILEKENGRLLLAKERLSCLLVAASILELNTIRLVKAELYVGEVEEKLSATFRMNPTAINFAMVLDSIFANVNRSVIVGYTSGRGGQSLPSKPSIQILKVIQPIPLETAFSKPQQSLRILRFAGEAISG